MSEYTLYLGRSTEEIRGELSGQKWRTYENDLDMLGLKKCPHCNVKSIWIKGDRGDTFCEWCGKVIKKSDIKYRGKAKKVREGVIRC